MMSAPVLLTHRTVSPGESDTGSATQTLLALPFASMAIHTFTSLLAIRGLL
jgi:hypothetical protein